MASDDFDLAILCFSLSLLKSTKLVFKQLY